MIDLFTSCVLREVSVHLQIKVYLNIVLLPLHLHHVPLAAYTPVMLLVSQTRQTFLTSRSITGICTLSHLFSFVHSLPSQPLCINEVSV